MTGRRLATRRSSPDAFAVIHAQMEHAEARRRRALRLMTSLAVLGLAAMVLAAAVALASDGPAEPEPARTSLPASGVTATAAPEPAAISAKPQPEREPSVEAEPEKPTVPETTVQRLELAIGAAGYEPSVLSAKAGVPIRLTVERGEGCAAGLLIPALGVQVDNSAADASVDLGALEAGDYRFTCGMEMVEGVLEVR